MLEELRLEYSWTFARAKDSLHTLTALASQPVWNSHEVDSYVVFDLIYDVFLGLQRAVITLRDTGKPLPRTKSPRLY